MNCIGTYDGTIFYNPANKFCIVSVKTADQSVPAEARSNRRYKDHLIRFTAVGYEIPRTDAVELELDGEWTKGKYGVQLQVEQWREIVPRTKNGVEGYLASGLIKGIGPKTAADIVERFGVATLDILEHQPERLLEIRGITENKLEDIRASYAENRMLQGIMTLLAPFKITPKTALKIYQYFGPTSVEILEKSPFELCQISGFGFRRVDAIVQKSGGDLHDPMRIKGAVFCALDEGKSMEPEDLAVIGHTGDLLVDIYARNLTHIYILPQCSTTAARVLNPAGMDAQFERLRCAISRGILSRTGGLNMNTNYIIETKNLTKQYGSQKSVADLNIHVKRGRIYGLLGRNGAGKTTTMKMLLGLTNPTSGEVKIWGKSLQGNEKKLLPRMGSLIESPGFYPNLTGTENLRIFATLRGVPNNHAVKDALDLVGLPYKDKKLFSQYSLGMKQRLAIALAVMHDPELLILDEPINGLDPIGIAEVRSFIRELCDARGKTILISSHILSEISLLADDIGIIDHGALLEEESLAELEQKSSKHIRFTLSDTAQAARILERNFHESHFSIQDDHNLRLHNLELPVGKIVTAFVENGLEVSEAATSEESLEDYFKRVTGGEGIA